MKNGVLIPIIFGFIIFGAVSFYLGSNYPLKDFLMKKTTTEEAVTAKPDSSCANDVMKCIDGSVVKRVPPNCEFEQCPQLIKPVPQYERAIGYAVNENKILIKYDDKYYEEGNDPGNPTLLSEIPSGLTWMDLLEITDEKNDFLELFGFKVLPNKTDFLLVARYDFDDIRIYQYTKMANKLEEVLKITKASTNIGYTFPKLADVDALGNYASFNMFGCWNCGGHTPARLLWNLETGETKDLGYVSYFAWKQNGNYEYKDFVEIPCGYDGPGVCNENPDSLPLKTGSF